MYTMNNRDEKYYIVVGGMQQRKVNGKTIAEIENSEDTFHAIITLKRLKEKIIEFLNDNGIPYTKVIISPSIDLYLNGKHFEEYDNIMTMANYGSAFRMDFLKDLCSLDLTCISYIYGDEEELIYPADYDNFGLDLSPITIKYSVFRSLLDKCEIIDTTLPKTFGEYKKEFIDAETDERLGYNLCTDIVLCERKLTLL